MKNFVIEFGKGAIDVIAWLIIIMFTLASISMFDTNHPEMAFFSLILGMIIVVVCFFLLYLIIDMRDNLYSINKLLTEYIESEDTSVIDSQEISCSNDSIIKTPDYDKLHRLATLKEKGVISEDEYLAEKITY